MIFLQFRTPPKKGLYMGKRAIISKNYFCNIYLLMYSPFMGELVKMLFFLQNKKFIASGVQGWANYFTGEHILARDQTLTKKPEGSRSNFK